MYPTTAINTTRTGYETGKTTIRIKPAARTGALSFCSDEPVAMARTANIAGIDKEAIGAIRDDITILGPGFIFLET